MNKNLINIKRFHGRENKNKIVAKVMPIVSQEHITMTKLFSTVGIVTMTNSVDSLSRKSSRTFTILSLNLSNLSACMKQMLLSE